MGLGTRRIALLCVALAAGCAGGHAFSAPEQITRRTGGVPRRGRFVSAYSYEWFVRAELAVASGEYDAAVLAYRRALAAPYEDPLVLARLADALDRAGQAESAAEVLEHAEELDDASEAVWLTRAEIAKRHGRLHEAIEAYERAEAAAPLSAEPPLALSQLLRQIGNQEGALAVLERFARRSARGSANAARARLGLALARGDAEAASQAVDILLRVAPARVREVRQAAELALTSGHAVLASRLAQRLPRGAEHGQLRLRALLQAGQLTEAEQLLATEDPESLGGLVAVARGYLAANRPRRAMEAAEAALAKRWTPAAILIRARAMLQLGQFEQAASLFAEALARNPELWDARLGLAQALAASGLSQLAAESMARVPETPVETPVDIRAAVAEARLNRGACAEALQVFEGAGSDDLTALRASFLERAGDTAEANGLYARLAENPQGLTPRQRARARAERMAAAGNLDEAIAALAALVKSAPEDLGAAARLAELQERAGEVEDARRVAAAALRLAWEPAVRRRLARIGQQDAR